MRQWSKARQQLTALGVRFNEHLTTRPGEAVETTRQALLSGEVRIIAVGGDGTLNEVVNGYFDEARDVINPDAAIGLLPYGTGSDFCRTIGLKSGKHALQTLVNGQTRLIDVLKVELHDRDGNMVLRRSINVVSFGLGGEVVATVNSWRSTWPRWIIGHARFVAAALKALKAYQNRPVQIQLDDDRNGKRDLQVFSNFVVAANGRYAGGGMKFAPMAQVDDGLLDVVLTDKAMRRDIIKELPRIRIGAHLRNPKVTLHQSRQVTIKCWPPLPVEIDGDAAGFTPAHLTVQPSAIRFIVGMDGKQEKR